jgi:hypothetical protein
MKILGSTTLVFLLLFRIDWLNLWMKSNPAKFTTQTGI